MRLEKLDRWYLTGYAFGAFLFVLFIFVIKATTVQIYGSLSSPHRYTLDVAVMWSMLLSSAIFFVVMAVMAFRKVSEYHFAENIAAYIFVSIGHLLYAIHVTIECTDSLSVQCKYLYPVSGAPLIESSINTGLMVFHLFYLLSFLSALENTPTHMYELFTWGGSSLIVGTPLILIGSHMYGASLSCWNSHDLSTAAPANRIENWVQENTDLPFLLVAVAPVFVFGGIIAFRYSDLRSTTIANQKLDALTRLALLGVVMAPVALCAAYMLAGMLHATTAIICIVLASLGSLGPAFSWLPFMRTFAARLRKWLAPKDEGDEDETDAAAGVMPTAKLRLRYQQPRYEGYRKFN